MFGSKADSGRLAIGGHGPPYAISTTVFTCSVRKLPRCSSAENQGSMEIRHLDFTKEDFMRARVNPASPFARKVRIVLRERALTGQVEEIETAVSPVAPNAD